MKTKEKYFPAIVLAGGLILVWLAWTTREINFWPSDSYKPYVPTAARLFELPALSRMHELPDTPIHRLNMHGKEALVLGIAVMQRILNDTESLYPNVLLLLLSVFGSTLFIYTITARLLDPLSGFAASALFAASFWPVLYSLQGAHQPLVLFNGLAAIAFFLNARGRAVFYLLGGVVTGFMLFSSPTAIIYLPYFAALLFKLSERPRPAPKNILRALLLIGAGVFCVLTLFTWPDPLRYLSSASRFLALSSQGNHFDFYHNAIGHYLPPPYDSGDYYFRGAGWRWIIKYFLLIMPFLFPAFLLASVYLLRRAIRDIRTAGALLVCWSTPVLVEAAHVSQFGRNYFSWMPGIVFLTAYAFFLIRKDTRLPAPVRAKAAVGGLAALLACHALFNIVVLAGDILPSRMFTAEIRRWLDRNGIEEVLVYQNHPRNINVADMMNNPRSKEKIRFKGITSLRDARDGYILIPPVSGNVIWSNCAMEDYREDPALTELLRTGQLDSWAAAVFRPFAASRYWNQEEEICTYRDLILGHFQNEDRAKQMVYILDGRKLYRTLNENRP
ncbi:MAG: hypothetical protein Q8Q08_06495 [Candidatus Omnitrophota bacterium]|nr:hypothetical protein [Candidatus Omnitrophota bacterium]MDZ4243260.1 hypothetical protein [Candidatus Omnitrophota bacterium]